MGPLKTQLLPNKWMEEKNQIKTLKRKGHLGEKIEEGKFFRNKA